MSILHGGDPTDKEKAQVNQLLYPPASFGKATVCPPGYKPNKKWKRKPGQKQCIKERPKKMTLKQLQRLAKANDVSIYKRRKDNMGFTRTPLSVKALKLRLTKMKVPYSFGDMGASRRACPVDNAGKTD